MLPSAVVATTAFTPSAIAITPCDLVQSFVSVSRSFVTDALSIGETAGFAADEGATLHLDAVSGTPSAVTLDGGTFELGAVPAEKAWELSELHLKHGAKVRLPADGILRVHDVFIDGVKQTSTVFGPSDAAWVLSGKVITRGGTLFMLH